MPTYNEAGSGSVLCKGCAVYYFGMTFTLAFKEGDLAFRKDRALKGVLEMIAIKQVFVNFNGNVPIIKYIDTYNALYTDADLVDQADAMALAIAFQKAKIASLNNYIDSLC